MPLAVAPNIAPRPEPTARNALPVRSWDVSAAREAVREERFAEDGPLREPDCGPVFFRRARLDDFGLLETDMPQTLVAISTPVTCATPIPGGFCGTPAETREVKPGSRHKNTPKAHLQLYFYPRSGKCFPGIRPIGNLLRATQLEAQERSHPYKEVSLIFSTSPTKSSPCAGRP